MLKHRLFYSFLALLAVLVLFVIVEFLYIKYNGQTVPAPGIPRETQTLGHGSPIRYLVMADSPSIGQGAAYDNSYAVASAKHIAQKHQVQLKNVGVSGARAADVVRTQLPQALEYKPDVVLLAVGANDATHFTSGASLQRSLQTTVDKLRQANPTVRIVVTGSPAMGSVPRFAWPIDRLMSLRTNQINHAFAPIVVKNHLTFAPIAAKTGPVFAQHPELFAADKFHPDAAGYKLWIPVINAALDSALR